MTNINQFQFRSKFKKLLNDSNEAIITAAFENFCDLQPNIAREFLWQLTYSEESAIYVLSELGLERCIIPEGKNAIITFRNELRTQYEKLYPDLLKVDIPSECRIAYDNLVKQTGNNTILANVVYKQCYEMACSPAYVRNRSLFLLKSDNEKYYFGGLRIMKFNREEAEYLKPFHMEIHELLQKLYDFEKKSMVRDNPFISEEDYETPNVKKVVPEECDKYYSEELEEYFDVQDENLEQSLDDNLSENTDQALPEISVEDSDKEPIMSSSGFEALTLDGILKNEDVFSDFVKRGDFNVLFKIGKLGFDLNEVMAKKEIISDLLKASDALKKAVEAVELAAKAHKAAEEALEKTIKLLNEGISKV